MTNIAKRSVPDNSKLSTACANPGNGKARIKKFSKFRIWILRICFSV